MDEISSLSIGPTAHVGRLPALDGLESEAIRECLSAKLLRSAKKIRSSYPDRFDYSVYDTLENKFGSTQPRGGVIFGSPIRFTEAADCKHCFYRFEIDTYGRGCTFNCAYCYAKSYLSIRKWWNEPHPFPADITEIRKIFATVFESSRPHKYRSIMEKRVPLRIGSMSDSFMGMDRKYRVTYELLKILRFYRYPYIIFTRSDLIAEDDYLQVLDPKLCSVQMSISSLNEELTRKLEPGAPAPHRRLAALHKVSKAGFWTTVRINPFFPIYPDGYFTDPSFDRSKPAEPFPYFSWDMIETIAHFQIPSLLVGVVRLYEPNIRFMKKALGTDHRAYFGAEAALQRASFHYSMEETKYYYQRIKDLCVQHGVRFSTCYIGNDPSGDSFFSYQHLWDNKQDCCDAVGSVPSFKATCADVTNRPKRQPRAPDVGFTKRKIDHGAENLPSN